MRVVAEVLLELIEDDERPRLQPVGHRLDRLDQAFGGIKWFPVDERAGGVGDCLRDPGDGVVTPRAEHGDEEVDLTALRLRLLGQIVQVTGHTRMEERALPDTALRIQQGETRGHEVRRDHLAL